MSNGRIDDAEIKTMLSGMPEGAERDRQEYVLTTLRVLRDQVTSITQHCRFCDDNDQGPEKDDESEHQHWLMWMVGSGFVNKVLLPLAVGAGGVVITLAITGHLGG